MVEKRYIGCQYINPKNGVLCKQYSVFKKDIFGNKTLFRYNYCNIHLRIVSINIIKNYLRRYKYKFIISKINCSYIDAYKSISILSIFLKSKLEQENYHRKIILGITLKKFKIEVSRIKCFKHKVKIEDNRLEQNIFNVLYNRALSRLFLNRLIKRRYVNYFREFFKNSITREDLCAICHGVITKKQEENCKIVDLNCKHYYHFNCINTWYASSPKCPKCKTVMIERNERINIMKMNLVIGRCSNIEFSFPLAEWHIKYYVRNILEINEFARTLISRSKEESFKDVEILLTDVRVIIERNKPLFNIQYYEEEDGHVEQLVTTFNNYIKLIKEIGKTEPDILQKIKI